MMRDFLLLFLCFTRGLFSVAADELPSVVNSSETVVPDGTYQVFNVSELLPSDSSFLSLKPKCETALVAAPDGTIYFLDISSRKVLWSFNSGPPIYSSYHVRRDHGADEINAFKNDNFFIDCGEDWELYIHRNGLKKRKLPMSADEFLRNTPYVSADGVMSGSKKTTTFLVDAKSGRVVRTFRPDDFPLLGDHYSDEKHVLPRKDVEDWEESTTADPKSVDQLLYVLRTDYALKYTCSRTGKVLWYLMFSDIGTSFQCLDAENISGGIFSQGDGFDAKYKSDPKPKFDCQCQLRPVVYRIRDHNSLESLLLTANLPDVVHQSRVLSDFIPFLKPADSGKVILSLPSPNLFSRLEPVDNSHSDNAKVVLSLPPPDHIPLLEPPVCSSHNDNGKMVLSLPPTKYENFGILDLYRGGPGQQGIIVNPEGLGVSQLWYLSLSFVIALLIASILSYTVGKCFKLHKQDEDSKVQVVTVKKKKSRKFGTTKNGASSEKRKNYILRDNSVEDGSEIRLSERIEASQLMLGSHSDGLTQERKIGKLLVTNQEIAKGSNGTIVLEGVYDGRRVAVKRLVQAHHDIALKEIQNLIASDHHQNIVRWYGVEHDQDFVYLSLELCNCSLHDFILSSSTASRNHIISEGQFFSASRNFTGGLEGIIVNKDCVLWKANGFPSPHLLKLLRDIVNGLAHLHELGIIHRDLKPQNVLIRNERSLCAKISDMGISKRLTGDVSSLTRHATGQGSSGWQAPEQLRNERQTRAVDLFGLGCVLFFCITGGKHPFGGNLERDINIVNNQKDLFLIENIPEALDLISHLLEPDPELRPKAADVVHHPIFWSPELRLSFLRDASDRVELEDRESSSELLNALEGIGAVVFGGKWDDKLENAFLNDIGRYRRYKFDCVRDLLRVIRNKLNHYRELQKEIQEILGPVPVGFESYFSSRFPNLVMEVYNVLQRYCGEEEFLHKYLRELIHDCFFSRHSCFKFLVICEGCKILV